MGQDISELTVYILYDESTGCDEVDDDDDVDFTTEADTMIRIVLIAFFAYCKGGNFNIHIWPWFGYLSAKEIRLYL